jgi:hypothetical protein
MLLASFAAGIHLEGAMRSWRTIVEAADEVKLHSAATNAVGARPIDGN